MTAALILGAAASDAEAKKPDDDDRDEISRTEAVEWAAEAEAEEEIVAGERLAIDERDRILRQAEDDKKRSTIAIVVFF